jgi:hypothetical protein
VDLDIWIPRLSLQLLDISVGIFLGVIGHFWHQGQIIEDFNILAERGTFQLGGLAFLQPDLLYSVFIVYPAFGGMLESSIGEFCSSSIVYLLGHLLSIPDRIFIVAGFFIL